MGSFMKGQMCRVSILSGEAARAVGARQWSHIAVITPSVVGQLEPESEGCSALGAGKGVLSRVRCPVLAEPNIAVSSERAVRATAVLHSRHSCQLLGTQLLLMNHCHVCLHLALIGESMSAKPAGVLEVSLVHKALVDAHVVQGGKLLEAVRALGYIGQVVGALVFGQTAPACVALATLVALEGPSLGVTPHVAPVTAEGLELALANLAHIVALRSGGNLEQLMLV